MMIQNDSDQSVPYYDDYKGGLAKPHDRLSGREAVLLAIPLGLDRP